MIAPSRDEIHRACDLLFGPGLDVSAEFIRTLHPSGLKAAFRKKALATHPDRAKALGESETELNERFKELTEAYQQLGALLKHRHTGPKHPDIRPMNPRGRHEPAEAGTARPWVHAYEPRAPRGQWDTFYRGELPNRVLLLGRFMYYSRLISWQTLIDAISWQRKHCPPIGRLALRWNVLDPDQLYQILRERHADELFGECAVRKGYLTPFMLMALLGKQRRIKRPIGEYFIQEALFSPPEIDRIVRMQRNHNASITASG